MSVFLTWLGLYNGKVLEIGREKDGLYLLQEKLTPITNTASFKCDVEGVLWHLILGHVSTSVMQHISSLNKCVSSIIQDNCHICPLVKHHRLKFPTSCTKTVACFDLQHVDL